MSKLYIVGTPIGNLGDFSDRGIETLSSVDFIAAEDTRLSQKLLNHFEISTPMISYHQHNEKSRSAEIISRIQKGESCAVITDAGMPGISDPGEELVKSCAEVGIEVVAVPGPTAAMSALAISGLPTKRFYFEGFLDGKTSERRSTLQELSGLTCTLIFYEAPHKLKETLKDLLEVLKDREIALCREITKLHEEVIRTTISDAIDYYNVRDPRGEYVLIVAGAQKEQAEEISEEDAVEMVMQRQAAGVSMSQAAKEVAEITGHKKGNLYKEALKK